MQQNEFNVCIYEKKIKYISHSVCKCEYDKSPRITVKWQEYHLKEHLQQYDSWKNEDNLW